jgi:hypothetical protein
MIIIIIIAAATASIAVAQYRSIAKAATPIHIVAFELLARKAQMIGLDEAQRAKDDRANRAPHAIEPLVLERLVAKRQATLVDVARRRRRSRCVNVGLPRIDAFDGHAAARAAKERRVAIERILQAAVNVAIELGLGEHTFQKVLRQRRLAR